VACSTLRGRVRVLSRTDWTFHERAGHPPIGFYYDLSGLESKLLGSAELTDQYSESSTRLRALSEARQESSCFLDKDLSWKSHNGQLPCCAGEGENAGIQYS